MGGKKGNCFRNFNLRLKYSKVPELPSALGLNDDAVRSFSVACSISTSRCAILIPF